MTGSTNWIDEAGALFAPAKPAHFTDYRHCCECAEHDQTLRESSVERIGLAELGNPGWDPLCFCTAEGLEYYFPALVRLSLETADDIEFYFEQLLFHLGYGSTGNRFLRHCNAAQRAFVADFIAHMIETWPGQIEESLCTDEALATHALWKNACDGVMPV